MVGPRCCSLAAASFAGTTRIGALLVRVRIQAAAVARTLRIKRRSSTRDLDGDTVWDDPAAQVIKLSRTRDKKVNNCDKRIAYTSTVASFAASALAFSWTAACFFPTPFVYSPTGVESMGDVVSVPGRGSYGVTSKPSPPLISDSTIASPFEWFHGPTKSFSPYSLSPVEALKYWSTRWASVR